LAPDHSEESNEVHVVIDILESPMVVMVDSELEPNEEDEDPEDGSNVV